MANTEAIVELSVERLPELMRLSIAAHWNQNEDDWRYMLAAGHGWGLVLPDATLAASIMALPYGPFAWISMVLVLPEQRRRGHASRLLDRAIGSLRAAGQLPVLDATPAGHAVYRGLGFCEAWSFMRWQQAAGSGSNRSLAASSDQVAQPAQGWSLARLTPSDWPEVLASDARHFGARREPLLRALAGRLPEAAWVARQHGDGRLLGWLLGRPGRVATQLGPLFAESDDIAVALLDRALSTLDGTVFVDAPQRHAGFGEALRARGFVEQRPFTRMALAAGAPGEPEPMRLLAGPELG